MSDATILYFCELCGGSVDAEDVPEGITLDSETYACKTCQQVLALPLNAEQRAQVLEWVWQNLELT